MRLFIAMLLSLLTTAQLEARVIAGRLAQRDILAFAQLSTPDPLDPANVSKSRFQWKTHHAYIGAHLMKLAYGQIKKLEIETPPRYGKSEMAVRNFVSWHAGNFPQRDLLIVTATADLANEHGRDVRDYMRGPGYALAFGHNKAAQLRDDSQSSCRLQLVGGGKIQFYGRGQIPAGVGGHGIIFDDFFKNAEEAYSETERNTAWRCYVADCLSRKNSADAWELLIGSRKNADDVQGRLFDPSNQHYDAATAKEFVRIRIPALSEGDGDPLGRPKDEVCWPERFPKSFYISKREHKSDIVRSDFHTQDQCNPHPEEGTWFKKKWLKTYRTADLPKNLRNYVASDHAYRIQEKNDFSCLLCAGIDPTGEIWILPSTVWKKMETDVLCDEIFNVVQKVKPAQWWAARDAISGSVLPLLRRKMMDERLFFWIDDSIAEKKDLVARSVAIRGWMAMGMVHWPLDWPDWPAAEKQLLSFPGDHDDLVAALAMLGMGLDKMVKPDAGKAKDAPKPGTFAWHSWGQDKDKNAVKGWS